MKRIVTTVLTIILVTLFFSISFAQEGATTEKATKRRQLRSDLADLNDRIHKLRADAADACTQCASAITYACRDFKADEPQKTSGKCEGQCEVATTRSSEVCWQAYQEKDCSQKLKDLKNISETDLADLRSIMGNELPAAKIVEQFESCQSAEKEAREQETKAAELKKQLGI